jgi:hypothetical protein
VLNIPVTEIGLQCPGVVSVIGQGKAAGVPQHVRVSLELETRSRTSAFHKPRKACRGGRSPNWIKIKNRNHPAMSRVRDFVLMPAHRDIEYTVVQGLGRNVWKWTVNLDTRPAVGQEMTKAEKGADRASKGPLRQEPCFSAPDQRKSDFFPAITH